MDYKDSLNLPRTEVAMKANLARNEPKILALWNEMGLNHKLRQKSTNRRQYTLHDGPPYANGHIHIGHALNKILKDIIVKSKTMSGFCSLYIPGWDCHGLPIEHQVDKKLGQQRFKLDKAQKRKLCREYAQRFIDIQREEFIRLGVFGQWDRPYLTMDYQYEAAIVREFANFVERGLVYKGFKPIHWCFTCTTALAEAEVEYLEHTSPSIYVKFPLTSEAQRVLQLPVPSSVVIWTTTPWTLPANLAIALHPDSSYVAVQVDGQIYIMAEALMEASLAAIGASDGKVVASYRGSQLEGLSCRHPFLAQESKIILGTHVTLDQGTGCVHTAPGHGQEDYELGIKYRLPIYNPVDDQGNFLPEVEHFGGMNVFTANRAIVDKLHRDGNLLANQSISHSYPHCWRCKNPVIFRATQQWFISLDKDDLRRRLLEAVNRVNWIPAWGRDRIYGMLEARPDWCISRQRAWGVPIMAFYCCSCGYVLLDAHIIRHIAQAVASAGADIWFTKDVEALLPPGTSCPECGGQKWRQETDILDVWFDSGVSHAAVLEPNQDLSYPAQLYLEGSDQHRGWFHSSLITAVATRQIPPYQAVLTHGFVVDGEGKKMSKSAGNVIAPQQVINQHGAEILRLWVTAEDYRTDVRISPEILKRLVEAYRRIRNTCRYLLANLYDFDPRRDKVSYTELEEIDKWVLHQLQILIGRIRCAYDDFTFHLVYHQLHNFCTVELSAIYLDILKDRLYCSAAGDRGRRAAQTVLLEVLLTLLKLMAPVLCFTAEEMWQHLPAGTTTEESVHLSDFPQINQNYLDEKLAERWKRLLKIRSAVCWHLEAERKEKVIGSSLEAQVTLYLTDEQKDFFKGYSDADLSALFIVSNVIRKDISEFTSQKTKEPPLPIAQHIGAEKLSIGIDRAPGEKCQRCWMYSPKVGQDETHPDLCPRCGLVVGSL
jgi:isoleucyl-tRNA synthetase